MLKYRYIDNLLLILDKKNSNENSNKQYTFQGKTNKAHNIYLL